MRPPWFVIAASLVLPACGVYSSRVPLDEPTAAVFDEALLGTWYGTEVEYSEGQCLKLLRFNEREYLLAAFSYEVSRGENGAVRVESVDGHYRVFVTDIDGVRFLNVQYLEGEDFFFARYTVVGDELRFRLIAAPDWGSDGGLSGQFATSAELRAAVRARLNDPLLYADSETVLWRPTEIAPPTPPPPAPGNDRLITP